MSISNLLVPNDLILRSANLSTTLVALPDSAQPAISASNFTSQFFYIQIIQQQ